MGYSHYWRLRKIEAWKEHREAIIADFLKLIPHLPPLGGPIGEGEPEFGEVVAFNGRVHRDRPLPESGVFIEASCCSAAHEPFVFPYEDEEEARRKIAEEGSAFGSCKTNLKPYDLAVTSFLLLAKHYLDDDILLFANGYKEAMLPAAQLIERVLGYRIDPKEAMKHHPTLWLVEVEKTGERFIYRYYGARSPKLTEVQTGLMEEDKWGKHDYGESGWPFQGPYRVLQKIEIPEEELAKVGLDKYPIYPPKD